MDDVRKIIAMTRSTRLIGRVKKMVRLPPETSKARLKFISAVGPRMIPNTKGTVEYPVFVSK